MTLNLQLLHLIHRKEEEEKKQNSNYEIIMNLGVRQLEDNVSTERSIDSKASYLLPANGILLGILLSSSSKILPQVNEATLIIIALLMTIASSIIGAIIVFSPFKWKRYPEIRLLYDNYWNQKTSDLRAQCVILLAEATEHNSLMLRRKRCFLNLSLGGFTASLLFTVMIISKTIFL